MAAAVNYFTLGNTIVGENRGGVLHDYMRDPLGSVVALIDDTQTVTDTFGYWPYGEVRSRAGSTATPFTFVGTLGYFLDATTGFCYVRTRNLVRALSQWLTVDRLLYTPFGTRPYQYVGSCPVMYSDPSGLIGPVPTGGLVARAGKGLVQIIVNRPGAAIALGAWANTIVNCMEGPLTGDPQAVCENCCINAFQAAGATIFGYIGQAVGAGVGTAEPGAGNVAGAAVGAFVGGWIGSGLFGLVAAGTCHCMCSDFLGTNPEQCQSSPGQPNPPDDPPGTQVYPGQSIWLGGHKVFG